MKNNITQEIEEELELAELMVKDLQNLWNSYAKKALIAKQEREKKQEKKGFLNFETLEELIDAYGYGDIDDDAYRAGTEYFENAKNPPKQSVIEIHRQNIRKLLDNYKGTVKMLKEELNPVEPKREETIFEKMERDEREERYNNMRFGG